VPGRAPCGRGCAPCSAAPSPRGALTAREARRDGRRGGARRAARPERDPVLPRVPRPPPHTGLPLSLHAVRRMAAVARPTATPGPAEAREQLVTLLGFGPPDHRGLGGTGGEGLIPGSCRLGAGALPPAAQRRAHLDRGPHLIETAVRASELARRVGRPELLLVSPAARHRQGLPGRPHPVAGEIIAPGRGRRIGLRTRGRGRCFHPRTPPPCAHRHRDPRDLEDRRPSARRRGRRVPRAPRTAARPPPRRTRGHRPAAWSSWRGSLVATWSSGSPRARRRRPEEPEAAAPTPSRSGSPSSAATAGPYWHCARRPTAYREEPPAIRTPGRRLLIPYPTSPDAPRGRRVPRCTLTVAHGRSCAPDCPTASRARCCAPGGSRRVRFPAAGRPAAGDLVRLDGSLDHRAGSRSATPAYPRRGARSRRAPGRSRTAASRTRPRSSGPRHDAPACLQPQSAGALEDASVRGSAPASTPSGGQGAQLGRATVRRCIARNRDRGEHPGWSGTAISSSRPGVRDRRWLPPR